MTVEPEQPTNRRSLHPAWPVLGLGLLCFLGLAVWYWVEHGPVPIALAYGLGACGMALALVEIRYTLWRALMRVLAYLILAVQIVVTFLVLGLLEAQEFPLVADVRLSVPFAATTEALGIYTAPPGRRFLVLQATFESWNRARGIRILGFGNTIFEAEGRTYTLESAARTFEGACEYPGAVPVGGSLTCPLVFEIPEGVESGVLRFEDGNFDDRVTVPAFGDAEIPFAPGVDLELVSARHEALLGRLPPFDGETFLVLELRIRGVNLGSYQPNLSMSSFELESAGRTYSRSYSGDRLSTDCETLERIPRDQGSVCTLVFEVPHGLREGVLRYKDDGYADEVAFSL